MFAPSARPRTAHRRRSPHLLALLHGPLHLALRLVMVLMSLEGYPASA
ncbi:MAG TPA: hypothetical protein VKY90_08060 [Candidatus Dormibacteraeota bacterium]|nr:hypothetical protein [Candidatus Dormibacteraeota bacterium]